ncbi:MAG: Trk system potassium transporter TrkA [Clostridiales bacterium]|nr:Trk system potassium transporter TrkA [Clostridiales bacterium]
MKIIIGGGGKFGLTLVRKLIDEGHDITLIDNDRTVLEEAVNKYDIMAVQGNCAAMPVLREADVENAELLIASMGLDEANLLCCMTAHALNKNLHTIARIRNPEYNEQVYHMRDAFALSMTINPERQMAVEIERLLRYPGFLHRDSFAKDRVEIVEIKVEPGSVLCDCSILNINSISKDKVLVCAVLREGVALIPDGSFIFKEGDRLFVTAPTSNLASLLKNLGIIKKKTKKVMICGGSRSSYYLAQRLEKSNLNVTIIEKDREKCNYLAGLLPKATIINGDATNLSLLESEGLESCDAVIAMTGLDEMNIIISLYGNKCGTSQVITKIAHIENIQLLSSLPLGSVVDPKEMCSSIIVRYVRAMKNKTEAAVSVHRIADGQVEAEEFIIDGTAKHIGKSLKNVRLKKNVLIVCINRKSHLIIPDGNSFYEEGDTVIVVTDSTHKINKFNDIFEG